MGQSPDHFVEPAANLAVPPRAAIVQGLQARPRAMELSGAFGYCAYCGAELRPELYFCAACSTPYKAQEAVLTPPRPEPVPDSRLILQKAPLVFPMFGVFVVMLLASTAASGLFFTDRVDFQLLFQSAVLFVTTCVFATFSWRTLLPQFKIIGVRPAAFIGLALLIPLMGLNFAWHGWVTYFVSATHPQGVPEITHLYRSGVGFLSLTCLFCLFPAITEEIAFRGLVQHWLQAAIAPWHAVLLASLLFMSLHFSFFGAPYLLLVGLVLGWTKWKTRSLYPSMLMHFLHNFVVLLVQVSVMR